MTKKEIPPTDGLTVGLHLISLCNCFCRTPNVCENFNKIELKTTDTTKVIPIINTINNDMLF